jgi:hypothetical protein
MTYKETYKILGCKQKYYVEYVINDICECYYQLVRAADEAILVSFTKLEYLKNYMINYDIPNYDVVYL